MKKVPRVKIAHLPTRIEELNNLSAALEGPEVFVKRDDQTGLAFGGNKTRKLEFLIGDALKKEAKTVITAGAVQSNHCRQTAAAAARYGLKCILVLAGQRPKEPSSNYLLDQLLGVEVVFTGWEGRHKALNSVYEEAKSDGRRPYLIPYGGSNLTGATGYVFAIQEVLTQGVEFDWIVFPTSSGGTQAGMVAGAKIFGLESKILGISVDEKASDLQVRVSQLAGEVSNHLGYKHEFSPEEILVNDDYCEAGYGILTENEVSAINLFARLECLLLDPVYTGRAAGGMIDIIQKGQIKKNHKLLFWHTGGTPALFANQYKGIVREE